MFKNKKLKTILTCIVCGLIAFIITYSGVLERIDKTAEDVLYHRASQVDDDIKIIKIDDKTMNQMGDFSTWNRDVYAQLVETLCVSEDVRPAVIGFDVLFSSNKDEASDKRFAEACAKYNNVVTGFSYVFAEELTTDEDGNLVLDGMAVQEKVVPYGDLREVTEQGFVNALMDVEDSTISSAFVYIKMGADCTNEMIQNNAKILQERLSRIYQKK